MLSLKLTRYTCAAVKIPIIWALKYLMNRLCPFYPGLMAAVSLIREATVVIFEKTGGWLLPK